MSVEKQIEIDELIKNPNSDKLKKFLNQFDENDIVERRKAIEKITEETLITKTDIRIILKTLDKERENISSGNIYKAFIKLRNKNPKNQYFLYDESIIEITPNSIELYNPLNNKNNLKKKNIIAGFSLIMNYFCRDKNDCNLELYTFKSGNYLFNSFSVDKFLYKKRGKIFKGTFGFDVIKKIFIDMEKTIQERDPVYILGYDDGWYMPFEEPNKDYAIISYTDYEKLAYNKGKEIYIKYTDNQKKEIKKKFKRFIDITKTDKKKTELFMALNIVMPFRLYFIDLMSFFPVVALQGAKNSGKTSLADFYGVYFNGLWDEHTSGKSAKSESRLEDKLTTSTFQIVIDEWSEIEEGSIEILKEHTTSRTPMERKSSATDLLPSRDKIAPLLITSNELGRKLKESNSNSKVISLTFNDPISDDDEWIELERILSKKKLFSLVYDYTRNWKNKEFKVFIDEALKKYNIDEILDNYFIKGKKQSTLSSNIQNRKKIIKEKLLQYPRIKKDLIYALVGAYLYEKIFNVHFEYKSFLETLIKSRIEQPSELLDSFISFLKEARRFTYDIEKDKPVRMPKYLTTELKIVGNKIIFTSANKRDFQEYYGTKIRSLSNLCNDLRDGLNKKDLIFYERTRIESSKQVRHIKIDLELLNDIKKRKKWNDV